MNTNLQWLWTSGQGATNSKTGPIPSAYPADSAQAWASCEGCILRTMSRPHKPDKRNEYYIDKENPTCYFWSGRGKWVATKLQKLWKAGKLYDLETALSNRLARTKAVRMSAGGDPSSTPPAEYHAMRALAKLHKLAWLDYSHFWNTAKGAWLKGYAMASCDTWQEALEAVKLGWRAAVHLPKLRLPNGRYAKAQGKIGSVRYTLCPAQRPNLKITCNDCRLCDASKQAAEIIVFLNH